MIHGDIVQLLVLVLCRLGFITPDNDDVALLHLALRDGQTDMYSVSFAGPNHSNTHALMA